MTLRPRAPFRYEVLDGGRYMSAVIEGEWMVVAEREGWVQLQKGTRHDKCSYDGTYLSVPRSILADAFEVVPEADADFPAGRGVVDRRIQSHGGCNRVGAVPDESGSD